MQSALIAIAAQIGAPMVKRILQGQFGGVGGALAGEVVDRIATAAGVPSASLGTAAVENPDAVGAAIARVEADSPEMLALYAQGLAMQAEMARTELARESWISWAWRPAAMWGFGVLWFWNLVIIHVANAYWKIALPQTDLAVLFQLNAVYMGLYMGGHTVKDVVSTRWGAR